MQEQLTRRMSGEIVISKSPGDTLRKWREIFELSQKELASLLDVKPSVVCDFEKGRRASPGIATVKKLVVAMVEYDVAHGGKVLNNMSGTHTSDAIVDIREFSSGVLIDNFMKEVEGEVLSGNDDLLSRPIYGYTMIDSL